MHIDLAKLKRETGLAGVKSEIMHTPNDDFWAVPWPNVQSVVINCLGIRYGYLWVMDMLQTSSLHQIKSV